MLAVIGISGTLRRASYNSAVLRAAASLIILSQNAWLPTYRIILPQNAWLPTYRTLGAEVWPGGRLLIARAARVIDANGEIIDPVTRDHVAKFVGGFVEFVRRHRPGGR